MIINFNDIMYNKRMSLVDNILNIHYIDDSVVSLSKVLLIFYVLVMSNLTPVLLSKQLRSFIDNNRMAQHIVGILSLIVIITAVNGNIDSRTAIIYALLGYIWFVFSTKMDLHWNIIVILLLLVGYLYENDLENKEMEMKKDKVLTENEKNDIKKNHRKNVGYIVVAILGITIIGTLLYNNKKEIQYGGGYDILRYLFY